MYKNERSKIRGFWFYNTPDCETIARLISELSERVNGSNFQEPLTSMNKNIISLLNSARKSTNSKETTKIGLQGKAFSEINNLSVKEFFAALPSEASGLQKLQSECAPPVKTLSEIEKPQQLHRSSGKLLLNKSTISNEKDSSPLTAFFNSGQQVEVRESVTKLTDTEDKTTRNFNLIDKLCNPTMKPASTSNKPALMPPTMFTQSTENQSQIKQLSELTKDQILQALQYLIQNDTSFQEKLYEAFKKSIEKIK